MRVWMPTIETGTGAEVYATSLARGLEERGHSVDLDIVSHHYQYIPWLAPVRPRSGTDVTIANSWTAAAFAGNVPLVTIVHHVVHDPKLAPFKSSAQTLYHRLVVKPMELAALRKSATVVAVSNTTAAAIRTYLADVPVRTVLNGVDTQFFSPGVPKPIPTADRPIRLLFVGKPSRRKAFDLISQIVEELGDECHFTCIGSAPEKGLVMPAGDILGRVSGEALREAYRSSDFLLFPSRLEGFGYAAAEAMACGLPVVCSESGAVAEVVGPQEAGIAVSDDDPRSIANKLLAIWKKPEELQAKQLAARKRAVENFDEKMWVDGIEEVLKLTVGAS
ncbi:glycosyltransferase family 4 protein [Aurantiacibacter hainanensis]|uniref:glycosyltransferase family 4 protein n=1 Tax=Aurantiacibacter hainanensis TaxID=3076114 RepID=UPI0030C74365